MNVEGIKQRIYSVDFLRGVVMMIMLLDHTRDFVHHNGMIGDPTDPTTATVPLFFTRWITHFCAPTFVFLSGVSIYLQKLNGKTNAELSRFLLTRGLWLVLLEFTIVRFGMVFNLDYAGFFGMGQVIWVIGVSMIVMAALIYLPLRITGLLALLMIFGHNLLDRYQLPFGLAFSGEASFGQSLWMIFHQMGMVKLGSDGPPIFFAYPLIPWIGVMAAGWALGTVYEWNAERRRKMLLAIGVAATVLFVGLRYSNVYGDLFEWKNRAEFVEVLKAAPTGTVPGPEEPAMSEPAFTITALLNTQKYPPSLLFLLMTLGPALIVLALTDGIDGQSLWQKIGIVFGRVPLFFYILQWFVAHGAGIILSFIAGKDIAYFFLNFGENTRAMPPDHGFRLWVVYAAWIGGLIILYPLCLWYGNFKRRNKHWLLSYL